MHNQFEFYQHTEFSRRQNKNTSSYTAKRNPVLRLFINGKSFFKIIILSHYAQSNFQKIKITNEKERDRSSTTFGE